MNYDKVRFLFAFGMVAYCVSCSNRDATYAPNTPRGSDTLKALPGVTRVVSAKGIELLASFKITLADGSVHHYLDARLHKKRQLGRDFVSLRGKGYQWNYRIDHVSKIAVATTQGDSEISQSELPTETQGEISPSTSPASQKRRVSNVLACTSYFDPSGYFPCDPFDTTPATIENGSCWTFNCGNTEIGGVGQGSVWDSAAFCDYDFENGLIDCTFQYNVPNGRSLDENLFERYTQQITKRILLCRNPAYFGWATAHYADAIQNGSHFKLGIGGAADDHTWTFPDDFLPTNNTGIPQPPDFMTADYWTYMLSRSSGIASRKQGHCYSTG